MYRHILIPTDGSDLAAKAVIAGVALAAAIGARVTFLAVVEPFAGMGDRRHAFAGLPESVRQQALAYLDSAARAALDGAMTTAAKAGVRAQSSSIESEAVHEVIADAAGKMGADLIVMGSHGRRGVGAVLLGSVTQKVLAHCKLPVLVVR